MDIIKLNQSKRINNRESVEKTIPEIYEYEESTEVLIVISKSETKNKSKY